jgi:hypothetical protein
MGQVDIGDGTYVYAELEEDEFSGEARTRVRAGGARGGRAWFARITGADPKWTVAREFLDPDKSELSRSGGSGAIRWYLTLPGLYEFADFAQSSTISARGFVMVRDDGHVWEITRPEALRYAARLDKIRAVAGQLFDERICDGGHGEPCPGRWASPGTRPVLRAEVGELAAGGESWHFHATLDARAVPSDVADALYRIVRDARQAVPLPTTAVPGPGAAGSMRWNLENPVP